MFINEASYAIGSDGLPQKVETLPEHIPKTMYELGFNEGYVECSGTHEWTLFNNTDSFIVTTDRIYEWFRELKRFSVGSFSGFKMIYIRPIEPRLSCCLRVENEDSLFRIWLKVDKASFTVKRGWRKIPCQIKDFISGDEVHTKTGVLKIKIGETYEVEGKSYSLEEFQDLLCERDERFILTNNCQKRIIAGRLGTIASMMAIGNTQATSISGKRKGAGMVVSNGIVDHVQHYYAPMSFLTDWYKARGLENGYGPEDIEEEEEIEFGEEYLELNKDFIDIEFSNVKRKIDVTKKQEFQEL